MFRLMHIGDDTIGYDQQNEVMFTVSVLTCNGYCVVDDRRKIRWTVELHFVQTVQIMRSNFVHVLAVRMRWIVVQRELVRHSAGGR